ncbi:MAG TPA: hypothetical protein VMQ60_03930 [Acidobacteriaceae bacterium]|jgi:hypothetical protein|nr:hypothetical protein [Acidobacteriaceae bacterium]
MGKREAGWVGTINEGLKGAEGGGTRVLRLRAAPFAQDDGIV